MKKFVSIGTAAATLATPIAIFAQSPEAVEAIAASAPVAFWGLALAYTGAAVGTFLACLGSIIGVSMVGQSGAGLLTEKPELAGKVILLAVLPGSQGLYGMVGSLLFIFGFKTVITGELALSVSQGAVLAAAFLPVAITCLTSAPFQAKVCSAGMHMLAKDDKLSGKVIVMAALVETYALLGFLITFFMLNTFKAGIIVG